MASRGRHRARRRPRRGWIVLAASGLAVLLGVPGTWAAWTDAAGVTGTSVTAGTIDLKVDNGDSVTTSTLSMSAMVPGATSAQVLTLRNAGTAPLKWTAAGGVSGTDAGAYASAGALQLRLVVGGTRSGSGNAATCSGGTVLLGSTALTASTSTSLVSTRQGPLAAAATTALCVELTFDANAPQTLAGATAGLTLTLTATSDVS
ncbi:M73 family metallopeptidase [Nocardioides sp. TRM66260-LWL]|uniref:SipW-dependent-type signal peptide-containing protein n=1 Tax=Nocardioides sp. TRM66260-LWL TaxID=2874478 RepID=UPI001CC740FB|nr:SipW-dependent-type signal peptide-containing protein [Nocardioides sp. TRM66260-LWL]MBZ5733802.1 M73 family metallopeptidase [Nocardioides sp. TRM66260-LWL]